MNWDDALKAYESHITYVDRKSNKTIENYLNDLKHCSICTNINVNKLLTNLLKY